MRPDGTTSSRLPSDQRNRCRAIPDTGRLRESPSRRRSNIATLPTSSRETEDVRDLDDRVEPLGLAHERRQPAGFEVDQEGGADRLVHQRNSIVLPSIVMRSARSSPGSSRLG